MLNVGCVIIFNRQLSIYNFSVLGAFLGVFVPCLPAGRQGGEKRPYHKDTKNTKNTKKK